MSKPFKLKLFADKEKALEFQKQVEGELLDYSNPKDKGQYEVELILSEGSFDSDVPEIFPYCVCWIEN